MAYNEVLDGEVLYQADWESINNHTHTGATRDGTLIAVVPIGGVIAWLQDYTNTPALPANFVECNGQVLSDAASVYNGQTIPDLNGDARLLKGAASSGTASTTAHTHGVVGTTSTESNASATGVNGPHSHGVNFTSGAASATNNTYTVVWVMRIK